jgi:hypothetical protein
MKPIIMVEEISSVHRLLLIAKFPCLSIIFILMMEEICFSET